MSPLNRSMTDRLSPSSIVFVQGLTGNRENTWKHRNGLFWPRDLLNHDFPKARIMTYGYEVDVFRSSMTCLDRIYENGQSLGYSIVSQRIDCSNRPILFIAHSLGGLVCQQTLILSNTIDGLWQISSSSIGIVFMGTPHHGPSLSLYRDKIARRTNRPNPTNSMVDTLHTASKPDTNQVGSDFQSMLRRGDISLKIFCFYEALKTNDIVGKIVEEHSAVLQGYENCSINADHHNMTKFIGRMDPGYAFIRSIIVKWLLEPKGETANTGSVLLPEFKPCPSWLRPLDTEPFANPMSVGSEMDSW